MTTHVEHCAVGPDCRWRPLERLADLAAERGTVVDCGNFMDMGDAPGPGHVTVHLYKHYDTRRYLNLDDQGHAYRYTGNGYELAELADAIAHAHS